MYEAKAVRAVLDPETLPVAVFGGTGPQYSADRCYAELMEKLSPVYFRTMQ